MTTSDYLPGQLRDAARQWSTVRGIVRHWQRQDLVNIGFHRRRAASDAAGIRSVMLTARTTHDPDRVGDPASEVFESVLDVAATDSGQRRRAETISRVGEEWMVDLVVINGTTFWARTGDSIMTNGGNRNSEHGGANFIVLLTPNQVPDGFDLTPLAESETVAGRACDVVLAVPKAPDPYGETPEAQVFDMIHGGDAFRLSIDQETGILLRVVKLVDGLAAEICEFLEITLDEPLDEALFRPLT